MREIVLDTETTGLDPASGDRLVEIGCVELINHLPSGSVFHRYVNPERDVPVEAFNVHGLSAEFLAGHPVFGEIAGDFLAFIGDAPLVIHNAEFDLKFLNAELRRLGYPPLSPARATDTLRIARQRFPGAQASLDALCRRFGIDNTARTRHGALLDSELLAEVYLELVGGRQPGLALGSRGVVAARTAATLRREPRAARPHAPTEAEQAAHAAFVAGLPNPIWLAEDQAVA